MQSTPRTDLQPQSSHRTDSRSLNATPPPIALKPGATPDHPILAAVEDNLRDAKWVETNGQEKDLRAALGKTIQMVEELSTLLRVAYRTTMELETNLEVPPSNLKLVQVSNNLEDDELENDQEAKCVRGWRHKLQRAFLTPKAPPKSEDMPQLDALFTTVEQYDKMSIEYLSYSKIGKIMRHICALKADEIPLNAEYNFLTRAETLVDKWHDLLNSPPWSKGSNEDTSELNPEMTIGDGTEVDTPTEVSTSIAPETAAADLAE